MQITQKETDRLRRKFEAGTLAPGFYRDDRLKGFSIHAQKDRLSWVVRGRADGRQFEVRIGHVHELKEAEARKRAEAIKVDAKNGVHPGDERKRDKEIDARERERTLDALASLWFERNCPGKGTGTKPSEKVRRDYESMYRRLISPKLGKRKVSELRLGDFEAPFSKVRPGMQNYCKAMLRRLMRYAEVIEWRAVGTNFIPYLEAPPPKKRGDPNITDAEAAAIGRYLLDRVEEGVAPGHYSKWSYRSVPRPPTPTASAALALLMLTATGRRHGEVVAMRWEDVRELNGEWFQRLPKSKTKQHEETWFPLGEGAREILDRARSLEREGNPYVFPGRKPGQPIHNTFKVWRKAVEAAGRPDLRRHDIRHEFGTSAGEMEIDVRVIQSMLGHSDISTTQRYDHFRRRAIVHTDELSGVMGRRFGYVGRSSKT